MVAKQHHNTRFAVILAQICAIQDAILQSSTWMRTRAWTFTINNPTSSDVLNLKTLKCDLLVACLEKGETGTIHYQGYLELENACTMSALKKRIPRAHLEARRGSREAALTYCIKDSTDPSVFASPELGLHTSLPETPMALPQYIIYRSDKCNWPSPKTPKLKRSEILLEMKKKIDEGATDKELAEYSFSTYLSCYRGIAQYRLLNSTPRNHAVETIIIQGPTGTGKSKYCLDNYPGAYWKQRSNWWDGYHDQETVIIDEFYGWLPFDLILRICDRYPLLVETKGGQVNFTAKRIIFTTNQLPDRWYKNVYFKSFIRRVTKWIVIPVWGDTQEFEDYGEAAKNMINNELFTL